MHVRKFPTAMRRSCAYAPIITGKFARFAKQGYGIQKKATWDYRLPVIRAVGSKNVVVRSKPELPKQRPSLANAQLF